MIVSANQQPRRGGSGLVAGSGRACEWPDDPSQGRRAGTSGLTQVVVRLQVDPEFGVHAEVEAEAEGILSTDRPISWETPGGCGRTEPDHWELTGAG